MKKLYLLLVLIMAGAVVFGQPQKKNLAPFQDVKAPARQAAKIEAAPVQNYNPVVSTRAALDVTTIGNTFYDLQTNGTMAQRIYLTESGKMGAVWTRGITTTSYPDRGTGYNYFDGTAWGPSPTTRIENSRTGFPSIAEWGEGEIVVAHPNVGALKLTKRPTRGAGTWTTTDVPYPSGVVDPSWPSIMTSGPNHEVIHILALSLPVASGGALYQGLDGALLYWRSRDGGATWEKEGVILPQLTSPEYYGFSPDSYAWANPKGDTIAFVYGETWSEELLMVSYDAGETWNKTVILSNQYKGIGPGTLHLPFYGSDGSNSVAIDNNGVFHVAFGRMRATEESDGRKWYPGTDGLIYWNSMMPPVKDSLDLDTLYEHHQLVGWVTGTVDTIVGIPYYYVSMTSFPGILVDQYTGRVCIFMSGLVTDNPSNDENFRHVKLVTSGDAITNYIAPSWTDQFDLNDGIDDMYLEFVYPSPAKKTTATQLHYIVQSSDVPGSSVLTTSLPLSDHSIIYNGLDKNYLGVNETSNFVSSVKNYPNPFSGSTTFIINMKKEGKAILEITSVAGQILQVYDLGKLQQGTNNISFDGSSLAPGMYLYSVKVNGMAQTGRMIVK